MTGKAATVTVEFTKPYTVRDEEATHYEAGQVVEMSEDSANHFIKRGVAQIAQAYEPPVKTTKKGGGKE